MDLWSFAVMIMIKDHLRKWSRIMIFPISGVMKWHPCQNSPSIHHRIYHKQSFDMIVLRCKIDASLQFCNVSSFILQFINQCLVTHCHVHLKLELLCHTLLDCAKYPAHTTPCKWIRLQQKPDIVTINLWQKMDIVTIFPIPKSQFQYCSLIALRLLVSVLIGYCDYFGHVPR